MGFEGSLEKLVFSDLDGTLLDEEYSFEKSLKGINALEEHGIPLIFCTSKTKSENLYYLKRLGKQSLFIAENGSLINIPFSFCEEEELERVVRVVGKEAEIRRSEEGFEIILGKDYEELRKALKESSKKLGIKVKGFGDMGEEEVAKVTGLPIELARLAKEKRFNESFLLEEKEKLEELRNDLEKKGISLVEGSRFLNIYGKNASKGKAVSLFVRIYERLRGKKVRSYGIGDGKNDRSMLLAVDRGFLLLNLKGRFAFEEEGVVKINLKNGEGFSYVVENFILKE